MIVIDGYAIDATVTFDAAIVNEVTTHPVEDGADVADHVRARPVRVTIAGIVSDTPLGIVASERGGDVLPSQEAYSRLLEMSRAREPVSIETDDRGTFDDMVLESLSAPLDESTGDALHFTASFVQITLVENARATVPVAVPRAKKKVNKGAKPTEQEQAPPPDLDDLIKTLLDKRAPPKSAAVKLRDSTK
jgi:hypothetical protein